MGGPDVKLGHVSSVLSCFYRSYLSDMYRGKQNWDYKLVV
jgi:hypothetical protein